MFKLLFSFIVLFLTSYSYSQVTNPFFYEVTYEGKKSYILGSFHIGIGVNEFPSMVMEKFKNSKTHAYEMIIADEDYLNTLKMIHENPDEAVLKRYDEDSKKKTLLSVESQNKLMNLGIPKSFACKMTDSPESCFVVVYKDYV
ncbi:MAG: hypothetical protein H6620_07680, partial [Halobacteriovoraceae bacterium]|nr:hypothetical protein [Halobacteriovoraceae bacterium]